MRSWCESHAWLAVRGGSGLERRRSAGGFTGQYSAERVLVYSPIISNLESRQISTFDEPVNGGPMHSQDIRDLGDSEHRSDAALVHVPSGCELRVIQLNWLVHLIALVSLSFLLHNWRCDVRFDPLN